MAATVAVGPSPRDTFRGMTPRLLDGLSQTLGLRLKGVLVSVTGIPSGSVEHVWQTVVAAKLESECHFKELMDRDSFHWQSGQTRDHLPLGRAGSRADRKVHQQAVTVLHQGVAQERLPGLLPPLRSSRALGSVVLAWVTLLQRSPGKSTDGLSRSSSVGVSGLSLGRMFLR